MAVRQKNLTEIFTYHSQRYSLMEPADHGKLLYQNEFWPEHMSNSPNALPDVYAIYSPVIDQVERYLQQRERIILAIDGPCASGKSSLATQLAELYPSRILHMDDYYLPLDRRVSGWEQIPCANMDLERFLQEALLPAARGETITYQPYSCREGKLLTTTVLPPARLTIVEGSYSHHPLLAPYYDLKLFLSCSRQAQLNRLSRRESSHMEAYLQRWIPLEQAYYQTYDIPERSDFCFDTTLYFT